MMGGCAALTLVKNRLDATVKKRFFITSLAYSTFKAKRFSAMRAIPIHRYSNDGRCFRAQLCVSKQLVTAW